ncbi:MAG: YdcF family protein, partial [Myxococcaceae bacterium]|nr:YdcF family protein [Myxococcaceae bacterium]
VENAEKSKALVTARGFSSVLVVTSAFHMPRAQGCFRAVGLEPSVLPVDFRMRAPEADGHWLPRAGYFGDSAQALRELFGRFTYRLTGKAK